MNEQKKRIQFGWSLEIIFFQLFETVCNKQIWSFKQTKKKKGNGLNVFFVATLCLHIKTIKPIVNI